MSPSVPSVTRPVSPDDRLLEEAASRLATGALVPVSWSVETRIDRPRSSIFPLRATAEGRDLGIAFYKVMLPSTKGDPDRHRLRIDRARTGLGRAMQLEDRLALLLEGEAIAFSRALAVDPETLTSVTIGVQGEPLGSLAGHVLTRSRRRRAARWMELTGRAARAIEACTVGDVDDREGERSDLMSRRIDRLEGMFPPERVGLLRRRVEELHGAVMGSDRPLTYAHGDFSPTNLLVSDEGIGLIDFEWVPRLRVFDLANLVFRLEFETPLPERMVRPLVEAALRGYGESNVMNTPHWTLHRISNLLKVVRYGPRPFYQLQSGRTRRAFAELEALAGSASQ